MKTVSDPADARLVAVETLLSHVQHELAQLHEALLAQQEELRTLRASAVKLNGRVDRLEEDPETGDPRDDEPPHY